MEAEGSKLADHWVLRIRRELRLNPHLSIRGYQSMTNVSYSTLFRAVRGMSHKHLNSQEPPHGEIRRRRERRNRHFTVKQVVALRNAVHQTGNIHLSREAERYGVSPTAIIALIRGKTYKDVDILEPPFYGTLTRIYD